MCVVLYFWIYMMFVKICFQTEDQNEMCVRGKMGAWRPGREHYELVPRQNMSKCAVQKGISVAPDMYLFHPNTKHRTEWQKILLEKYFQFIHL